MITHSLKGGRYIDICGSSTDYFILAGTGCIEVGVPAVVLKRWLGHTNILVTLDTYADVFDRLNFDSTRKFDELMERISQE